MPPAFPYASLLRSKYDLFWATTVFNGSRRSQNALLWARKPGQGFEPPKATRRSLFELHAGRGAPELPPDLALDEVSRTKRESDTPFTTSERLIKALGPVGLQYARAQEAGDKPDYTFVDPALWASDRMRALKEAEEARERSDFAAAQGKFRRNLKELLVQYLQHVDPLLEYQTRLGNSLRDTPQLDNALLLIFDNSTMRHLHVRGYDITHLMGWAWILKADTTERAASRLTVLTQPAFTKKNDFTAVPQFLIQFLLRRQNISARALRPILIYIWEWMKRFEKPMDDSSIRNPTPAHIKWVHKVTYDSDDPRGMMEDLFMLMIIRLLRSARKVWPAACESIVALMCRYLNGINFRKGTSRSMSRGLNDTAQLTFMYNTVLKLLALPSSQHPYQTSVFQQRAQFSVLRRMNDFDPPLIVDRRGYRAVVSMQLMHKKTLQEREWAHMKAKSWPPWKEEKLGIDASIGVEHGISRARQALNRAREAGYASGEWDAAASILSGWDTDGSPTIQTRAASLVPQHRPAMMSSERRSNEEPAHLWAARIRATRTLDEAWSCFLSYKSQTKVLRPSIYYELYDKITYNAKRASLNGGGFDLGRFDKEGALPGDGKEVLAAPVSPKEAIYIPRAPPTSDEFLKTMVDDGVRISKSILASLLTNAPSFQAGIRYLEASRLPSDQLCALFDENLASNHNSLTAIESLPQTLFGAFIRFLTLFAPTLSDRQNYSHYAPIDTGTSLTEDADSNSSSLLASIANNQRASSQSRYPLRRSTLFNPLARAVQLLRAIKPKYRPAWYHVLRVLAKTKTTVDVVSRFADQDYHDIKTWRLICRLLDDMREVELPVDLDGFYILCTGLEKAIFAAERLSRLSDGSLDDENRHSMNLVLTQGLPLMKAIFKDTVRAAEMQQSIPALTMSEKSEIDRQVEETNVEQKTQAESDIGEDTENDGSRKSGVFLPPACLLPKLLEVPGPAELHAFVRLLGLRRDYEGLLDLIEWMALFADEVNTVVEEKMNGRSMMRRCLTATRVFMERSWIDMRDVRSQGEAAGHGSLVIEADPAPVEIIRSVHSTVLENKRWGGWPTEDEVVEYCSKGKFL